MNIRKYSPLIVIVLTVVVIQLVSHFKPEAKKKAATPAPTISVESMTLQPQRYQVVLDSFGKISPRTRGQLSSQVSGQIIDVNPNFNEGGFFEAGDVLLTIDPRDYKVQVEIAEAELAEMRVGYEEQQALADQAQKDWRNLGRKGKASDFALRKPQLEAAKLKIDSARAKLKQSRLAVERTQIKAPYRGRVLVKSVDIGGVVSSATKLAEIYAVDRLEIALPLKNSELPFIELPESNLSTKRPKATIINSLGADSQRWSATVVRTAGAIDEKTQQLYITAQIDDPFGDTNADRRPLKIGQFVTAQIEGRTVEQAMIIPNSAIYQGSYIYLLKDGLLQRTEIKVAWQNAHEALISEGVQGGDELVITPLGQVSSGTRVKIVGAEQENKADKRSVR
ncbi:MAG: efflux RND transporter periplasmic adaptor subunit [Chromatiales bacterium]|nr:efflux RND transporter periplasmic adaptor subunit [Chromatiales bacterium]